VAHFDAIIVGGGHNGLTCAAYLASRRDAAAYPGFEELSSGRRASCARCSCVHSRARVEAPAFEEPTGPLAFAGEHTAGPYAALMEGAIRSGQRAARSLLRRTPA
jgi:uncharacterized protein with NAD-binding domain and iron-sulfur cluster